MTSLPYDIVGHIINILAAEGDLTPIKRASLASSSVLHLCRKHIFHTIPSHSNFPQLRSLKKHFLSLLIDNPTIAQYIRVLDYELHPDDHQLSPFLPNSLQTISQLECLKITGAVDNYFAGKFTWTEVDPLLRSALLHLMHLPTLTHLVITSARDIPISALALCINLKQLDIRFITLAPFEDLELDLNPSLQMSHSRTPRILHFRNDSSQTAVKQLLRARWKDGRPVLDFTHVNTLVLDFDMFHDVQLTQELFKSVQNLEELHINAQYRTESLAGLSEMISVNARNLKTLQVVTVLNGRQSHPLSLMAGLCNELEALAGNKVLQTLKFTFNMGGCESKAVVETAFSRLEEVLMDRGWSALMHVSIEIKVMCCLWVAGRVELKSIPDMYLGRLSSRKILYYNCPDLESE